MVEIQLTHPTPCASDRGCTSVQVLAERVGGLDEQVQRHEAALIRLFERLDGIYKQNVAILIAIMVAVLGIVSGLICLLAKR